MTNSSVFEAELKHIPDLKPYEELYKDFHRHPELSTLEKNTSAKILSRIEELNKSHGNVLEIKANIGGTGLIVIHRNGDGPTILLRADIDGLPIKELTGLDYASTDTQVDTHLKDSDHPKPTMHACGHDFHITSMLATIETLLKAKDSWSGTIIYLFQPAEERGCGARMMVDDGLYEKHGCPVPDVCLGQHVFPFKAGTVYVKTGPTLSAADSYKVIIHGRGGHGSMPHMCIDPVVIASSIVVRLQTLVSREVPPDETAVVTVGSLQAGDAVNVIADYAVLQVNIRSFSERWRKVLVDGFHRIVKAECEAGRSTKPPEFVKLNEFPLTDNSSEVVEKLGGTFREYFGEHFHDDMAAQIGSEDFSLFGRAVNKPYAFWFWGGIDPEEWDRREKDGTLDQIPFNHNAKFAPCIQPTLEIGVKAMVLGALTYVGKNSKKWETSNSG